MAESLGDERDRRAVVDRVRGVGMAQPVRRGVRVAAGALHDRLQDVVDAPLGNREHHRLEQSSGFPAVARW